jgi:hypothetical protein
MRAALWLFQIFPKMRDSSHGKFGRRPVPRNSRTRSKEYRDT